MQSVWIGLKGMQWQLKNKSIYYISKLDIWMVGIPTMK